MEKKEIKEKKLTDEEIVKALKFAIAQGEPDGIGFWNSDMKWCGFSMRDVLDLINRLKEQCSKSSYKDSWKNKFFKAQEEIEYLKQHADQFLADYQKAQKEIERLTEELKYYRGELQ